MCIACLQGNEMGETLSRHASELKLPQHHSSHRDLAPYTDLMFWLKDADLNSFKELAKVQYWFLSNWKKKRNRTANAMQRFKVFCDI